jgi:hypothetical protein
VAVVYLAAIGEEDYEAFRALLGNLLPAEYEMWLRVRARGRLRASEEGLVTVKEIDVHPDEFKASCGEMARPDFSIHRLDIFAREKARAIPKSARRESK